MKSVLLAAFVAMAVTPAMAADQAPVIQAPVWMHRPNGGDMASAYPGFPGQAIIRCSIDEAGKLVNCEVLKETRPGLGSAALKLTPRFQMKPTMADGRSVKGGVVVLPIRWSLD